MGDDRELLRGYLGFGLTQAEVAEAAQVAPASVSMQSGGFRKVTPHVLAAARRLAFEKALALFIDLGARLGANTI